MPRDAADVTDDDLSPGQKAALDKADRWLTDPFADQVHRIFGFAGTGKTTIARRLARRVRNTAFMAFTGKAALVMARNGCAGATTIHSAIYSPHQLPNGELVFTLNPDGAAAHADLIVVDECSMVDEDLAFDLMSFRKPILVLGDPFQLPPVKGAGFFVDAEPDSMLTEVHRQAAESPILRAATAVREGRSLTHGDWGEGVLRILARGTLQAEDLILADQVIVGLNATREAYNRRLRQALGRTSWMPEIGDKLICLKNNHDQGLMNGGMFEVLNVPGSKSQKHKLRLTVQSLDFIERGAQSVQVLPEFFAGGWKDLNWRVLKHTDQFTYGYAITCHKSQGSQFDHVILYDEGGAFRDDHARWLYTGITRASERLTLVM